MCDICNGQSNCPVCSEDQEYIECDICNGTGKIYFDVDFNEISEEYRKEHPEEFYLEFKCENCDGSGEIPFEHLHPDEWEY